MADEGGGQRRARSPRAASVELGVVKIVLEVVEEVRVDQLLHRVLVHVALRVVLRWAGGGTASRWRGDVILFYSRRSRARALGGDVTFSR